MELNRETMKKMMLLILYTVAILAAALQFEKVVAFFGWILGLLLPFFIGAAIAFVLNVPMRCIERALTGNRLGRVKGVRGMSLVLTLLFMVLLLGIVFFLVVPQLTETMMSLTDSLPAFFGNIQQILEQKFVEYPDIVRYLEGMNLAVDWKSFLERAAGFVTTGAGTVLSSTLTAAVSIANGLVTFGIACIFAIYILLQKENLGRQFKKLFYAYFPERAVGEFFRILRMSEQIFSRFLAGQCTEAVILGAMFFVTLSLFRLPYSLLIGVLIAFTALIPIFGAFIGCAVGVFLMLVSNPIHALWFLAIFLVLQQVEGNLIYPHVVGNSVGLPPIWVLAAVTIGASVMGVAGMLLFIPLCSVVYTLLREDVNRRLTARAAVPGHRQERGQKRSDGEKKGSRISPTPPAP